MASDMNDSNTPPALFQFSKALTNDTGSQTKPSFPSDVQDHSLPEHSSRTLFSRQFIPVAVLTVILLIFLASRLLNFPRILHILPLRGTRSAHGRRDSQGRRKCSRPKAVSPHARSLLNLSSMHTRSKESDLPLRHDISTLSLTPTVRLVRGCRLDCSLETGVYLPEEITLPHSSPTLVCSSPSKFSAHRSIPPKVYLSPTLLETFDLGSLSRSPEKRGDAFSFEDGYDAVSGGICVDAVNSEKSTALASSPRLMSIDGLNDALSVSSRVQMSPLADLQASLTPSDSDNSILENESSHSPVTPELNPPPLALANPILVRRALSPWRSRPLPEAYDTISVQDVSTAVSADPKQPHLPSIPSRLRYFITRSAPASLASSYTSATPESSLGKRSKRSSRTSKLSRSEKRSQGSSLFQAQSYVEGYESQNSTCTITPHGREHVPLRENTDSPERESHDIDPKLNIQHESPHSIADLQEISETPSPGTSDGSPSEFQEHCVNTEEGEAEGAISDLHEKLLPDGLYTSTSIRASATCRPLVGLGFRVGSGHVSTPPVPRQRSIVSSSNVTEIWWNEGGATAWGKDEDDHVTLKERSPSLRTVFGRWMTRTYDENMPEITDEERSLATASNAASESVEIMVVDTWNGM